MYHPNVHTKIIILNTFNQLEHMPPKALGAQWVHPKASSVLFGCSVIAMLNKHKIKIALKIGT